MDNRIKLAEIEGNYQRTIPIYEAVRYGGPPPKIVDYRYPTPDELPTYESRDDLQRIIDGMDKLTLGMYWDALVYIFNRDRDSYSYFELLTATVEQIQEAILRACGKWDESKVTDGEG